MALAVAMFGRDAVTQFLGGPVAHAFSENWHNAPGWILMAAGGVMMLALVLGLAFLALLSPWQLRLFTVPICIGFCALTYVAVRHGWSQPDTSYYDMPAWFQVDARVALLQWFGIPGVLCASVVLVGGLRSWLLNRMLGPALR